MHMQEGLRLRLRRITKISHISDKEMMAEILSEGGKVRGKMSG